jgi:hypothetical protein
MKFLIKLFNMSRLGDTPAAHMDDKKEPLEDTDIAEVNETDVNDTERSGVNLKKLIRKVYHPKPCTNKKAKTSGRLPSLAGTRSPVPILLPRPNCIGERRSTPGL